MKHTSTRNLLVKNLYGETSQWENDFLADELNANWKLKEEFEAFQEVVMKLDSEVYSPCKTSIQIILEHSRKTAKEIAASC
ncbi:MAG TPA: hypothetical protein VNJ07_13455 [Chitinophagales bacterium]|nr:hypothetical protein [Chitinophagales bacterium]